MKKREYNTIQLYVFVFKEMLADLLPLCLDDLLKGLYDKDGDVKSVAAKALRPTTNVLISDPQYKDFVSLFHPQVVQFILILVSLQ